jgi:hypothetical protein
VVGESKLDGQTFALQFGASTDVIAPADYTVMENPTSHSSVRRRVNGTFFDPTTSRSSHFPLERMAMFLFRRITMRMVKADFAVFRPSSSNWFISQSSGAPTRIFQFGISGDKPVVADYDNDGKADVGIFRQAAGGAEWWIRRSTAGSLAMQFGANTDKPVQGDYTGDGKADIAIWRPSTGEWLIVRSEDFSFYGFPSVRMATSSLPEITTAMASSMRPCSVHRVRRGSSRERLPEHRSCSSVLTAIGRCRMHLFLRKSGESIGSRVESVESGRVYRVYRVRRDVSCGSCGSCDSCGSWFVF